MARTETIYRGEQNHNAKLTERDVRSMRRMHKEDKLCIRCISKLFNTPYHTVRHVVRGFTWAHVKDEEETI